MENSRLLSSSVYSIPSVAFIKAIQQNPTWQAVIEGKLERLKKCLQRNSNLEFEQEILELDLEQKRSDEVEPNVDRDNVLFQRGALGETILHVALIWGLFKIKN